MFKSCYAFDWLINLSDFVLERLRKHRTIPLIVYWYVMYACMCVCVYVSSDKYNYFQVCGQDVRSTNKVVGHSLLHVYAKWSMFMHA